MEYIDLRKMNKGELKQVRWQVVCLKKMGKTGKEIEELTGSAAESRERNMDGVSARGRQFHGTEETRFSKGGTSTVDTGGTGGNTRNGYYPPPRGIRYSRQFVDTEESVCIRLEKVSEKDIGWQCVGLYAALGIDVPASGKTRPETGSFPYLKVAGGGISSHRPASQGGKCRDLLGRRDRDRQRLEL